MARSLPRQSFAHIMSGSEGLSKSEWAKALVDQEFSCHLTELSYGELIGDHNGYAFADQSTLDSLKGCLGFIASGDAEIYEESALEGSGEGERRKNLYHAYRPIRLLSAGDLFGEFAVMDHIFGDIRAGQDETWQFCAGKRSIMVRCAVHKGIDEFSDANSPAIRTPHVFLNKYNTEKTVIGFFQPDELLKSLDFFRNLTGVGWRRSASYRQSFNSYNFIPVLEFRRVVQWHVEHLLSLGRPTPAQKKQGVPSNPQYSNQIAKSELVHAFSDALYDALNRPIRGEPVFASVTKALSEKCLARLDYLHIDQDNVLTACWPDTLNEFYYPIDLQNYFINAFCKDIRIRGDAKIALGWEKTKSSKKKNEDSEVASEGESASESLETVAAKETLRGRLTYYELAKYILKKFAENDEKKAKIAEDKLLPYERYPFSVECLDIDSLDTKSLLLRFKRRNASLAT